MNPPDGTVTVDPPVSFVPVPSDQYRTHRKLMQTTKEPGRPEAPAAPVAATPPGSRVLLWKQDPSVTEIGVRKAFLPGAIVAGPRDARIQGGSPGIPSVSPNAFGDFIVPAGSDEFDAVHTFAVVRQTLTLVQRALAPGASVAPVPWQWNSGTNSTPLNIFPHGLPNTKNAFYSRNEKALKFGHFVLNGSTDRVHTCRSFDIVAHETGHAVLDGLRPGWLGFGNPPQTGGLHESFGDLCAVFLALSQHDQVEAVIAQTKGNLHDKTFLADVAEQFGLALGRPNGLRNADNDFTLAQTGNQVHAISQVFTGAIYDVLADVFDLERAPVLRDDATVLHKTAEYVFGLVMRAIVASPATGARYADVANQMLTICKADGKPVAYRDAIRNRFQVRGVVTTVAGMDGDEPMEAVATEFDDAVQDRSACCGTMTSPEFMGLEDAVEREAEELCAALAGGSSGRKRSSKK